MAAAGLDALTPAQLEQVTALNAAYHERFGMPFVICARDHPAAEIIDALSLRVANDRETERLAALDEIAKIARLRLDDLVEEA